MSTDNIPNQDPNTQDPAQDPTQGQVQDLTPPVSGMYQNWFLDYASYVILERAVPAMEDGLKPVQRRILHALKEMDDGRFNKVANVIGATMQYHPHGDASIGDAIVTLGQKNLLIETQGNWGDVRTGDSAAAPRYIEARLSKFALEVVFNPQTTEWQLSYDGRKKEPVTFPLKFPLLLAQGVEGIAVGLSTKVLPHNFIELLQASIAMLKGKKVSLYPDFGTGGMIDVSDYNDGQRGGKVRVRAHIEEKDKKTLLIKDIPYGVTTTSLIDSIIKANDKGKIKIKKVVDNTAKDVEIEVQLGPGQSPDIVIDALYAFTDCEVSISPNTCVIVDEKPRFLTVTDLLTHSTDQTVELLRRELEIKRHELQEKLLFSSLEKIFIENRIYRDIEECETWEAVLSTIDQGLEPFKPDFYREITQDDIIRLTEIKIKRISRFDSFKADELMRKLEEELRETEHHLANLVAYAISWFEHLLQKYGKGRERKTEIKSFDTIQATVVAANNAKLYVNRKEGFIGYGLKKDEFVMDCSDLDDVIVFRRDGKMVVTRIQDKVFVGKDILYCAVWKKNNERMVYHLAYLDAKTGRTMVKRFQVMSITRDREYDLTSGAKGSKTTYFTANPNGEAESITVKLTASSKARVKIFDFDFAELDIKGRQAKGNILTRYPVRTVTQKSVGPSTLGGLDIWYDGAIGRLNTDERGKHLGKFLGDDTILVVYNNGDYELTNYELTNRYEPEKVLHISRFDKEAVISALYYDGAGKTYYVKRFNIETSTLAKKFMFVPEHRSSKVVAATTLAQPQIEVTYKQNGKTTSTIYDVEVLTDIKGWKALGGKFPVQKFTKVKLLGATAQDDVEATAKTPPPQKAEKGFEPGSTVDFKVSKPADDKGTDAEEDKRQMGLF